MVDLVYQIRGLRKIYKKGNVLANDGIDLDIRRGEIFGLFGPNGAGKTTLVKQMAGLIKPTEGSIHLFGQDVLSNSHIIPHYIAYFGQTPTILGSHKVWEAVYFTGLFRGMAKKEAKRETERLMEELGLVEERNKLMDRISGGQKRLLGVASTLIGKRPVLIMDEPTNDLDPSNRRRVWDMLTRLNREEGLTIVLVTHNILEAEQVVERVAIVDKGKIIAEGTPGELKAKVDSRVRLELKLKPGAIAQTNGFIASLGEAREIKTGHWQVFVSKEEVKETFNKVIGRIGFNDLDDFRLITTTLEDVYLQMGGSKNAIDE
jgi:ABC-2 type transport system ATP-binding protein